MCGKPLEGQGRDEDKGGDQKSGLGECRSAEAKGAPRRTEQEEEEDRRKHRREGGGKVEGHQFVRDGGAGVRKGVRFTGRAEPRGGRRYDETVRRGGGEGA